MAGLGPEPEPRPLLVKIVMAGESSVGKTSIVRRYTDPDSPPAGSPAPSYMATIGKTWTLKTNGFMSGVFQKSNVGSGRFLLHGDSCNGEDSLEIVAPSDVKEEDT